MLKETRGLILLFGLAGAASPLDARPAYILATNPFDGDYVVCDMSTGEIVFEATLAGSLGEVITGTAALTEHPTTGAIFVIVGISGQAGRSLGVFDLDTGLVTVRGNTGDNVSSITFDDMGILWATTGDGATTPETLWTVDTTNGALTMRSALGGGADGEVICFNPVDGLLYHWSGNGTVVFESINRMTFVQTNIPITGMPRGEIFGVIFDATINQFLVSNISDGFDNIAASGTYTQLPLGTASMLMPAPDSTDVRGLVDLDPSCTITAPMAGGSDSGDVDITFDASSAGNPLLNSTFEYSTDAGGTWATATAAAGSMLANPDLMRSSPIAGETFVWDTAADGIALVSSQLVSLRITTNHVLFGETTCVVAGVTIDVQCPLCGDCDQGGAPPTILDALTAAQIAAGISIPTSLQTICCDVNNSTTITILDALAIAQVAAGLPTVLTCP